jgi:hypothetical protein
MKNKIIFTKGDATKSVRESSLGQILILKSDGWLEETIKLTPKIEKEKQNGKKQS